MMRRLLSLQEAQRLSREELRALRSIGVLPPMAGGAVTAKVYGQFLLGLVSSTAARRIDWDADTIMAALATSSYTPNQDTDDFYDDFSTNELATGNGYTTKGVALTTSTPTYDTGTNEVRLTATSPVSWTFTGTKAFRYGIIFKDTGTAGTSPLIAYVDFGAQSITDTVFNWNIDGTYGMVKLTAT